MNTTAKEMIEARGLAQDLPMMEEYITKTHPLLPAKRIPYAEYLLHWDRAKEAGGLFQLFNNKLIISKQVSYNRSNSELERHCDLSTFHHFSGRVRRDMISLFRDIITSYVNDYNDDRLLREYCDDWANWRYEEGEPIGEALNRNPEIRAFYLTTSLLLNRISNIYTWLDNHLDIGGFSVGAATLPGCSKKFVIQDGIKPVRAVTRFIEFLRAYGQETGNSPDILGPMLNTITSNLEGLRQAASMLTNQRKVSGKLSVSIHPMDFMTMSEPENGWSSCMRWDADDPGEYHAGTLEMMTSGCVVVAYLESKDSIYPGGINYTWNKKKWRELFVVTHDFISGIKGYPYRSGTLENLVFEMLADLAGKNWNVKFNTENIDVIDDDDGIRGMQLRTNYMYNDWEYNKTRAIVAEGVTGDSLPNNFWYGEDCYCLVCGKSRGSYDDDEGCAELLCCDDCDGAEICPICGRRIYDGLVKAPDGRMVCDYCIENYVACEKCGAEHYTEDMRELRVAMIMQDWRNQWVNRHVAIYVCDDCVEEIQKMFCGESWFGRGFNYEFQHADAAGVEWLKNHSHEIKDRLECGWKLCIDWIGEGEVPDCIYDENRDRDKKD